MKENKAHISYSFINKRKLKQKTLTEVWRKTFITSQRMVV